MSVVYGSFLYYLRTKCSSCHNDRSGFLVLETQMKQTICIGQKCPFWIGVFTRQLRQNRHLEGFARAHGNRQDLVSEAEQG